MSNACRLAVGAMMAAVWATTGGCSGKPPVSTSMTEATVTGTVTIHGEPATEGEVEFDPANYQRKMVPARRAPVGPDGRYTIQTLVGQNTVRFVTQQEPTERGMAYDTIVFNVQEGVVNTLDIPLPLSNP